MATTSDPANMDVPISIIDIGYIIDAAETFFIQDFYYISYILLKEAEKILETLKEQGSTEYAEGLEFSIRVLLSLMTENGTIKGPDHYAGKTTIGKLVLFYSEYKQMYPIDELREEEKKHKKWGILSANYQEAEGKTTRGETLLTTAKALRTALKALSRTSQEHIPNQFLLDTEYDKEGSSETYNIIEVQEAIESLKWGVKDFPSHTQGHDVLDCLRKFFKFQESSVSNQRENILNLLSNELMRTPGERKPAIDKALKSVFDKSLGNYIEWCRYLSIDPIWKNTDVISNEKKILYISLYYLIWGEAANVRFLSECLCYIFHKMSEQLDNGHVSRRSFIKEVIQPLYKVIAAEAKINSKRDAPHSKWRNYDDFNEYFWSPECLQLGWPLNINSPFFQRPREGSTVYGKTSFIEHRTFLHLYHSFHRMWIFHVIMFEVLAIVAFNDEKLNAKTLREILVVGPTYFLMKLIQSGLDIWLKDGAYSNTNRADVLQIRFRIIRFRAFCLLLTLIIFFVGIFRNCLQEKTSSVEGSIAFYACIVVLVIYACTIKWINQLEKWVVHRMDERLLESYLREEYVGRDMGEKYIDIFWYIIFWLVTLGINFAFTYYGLIRPVVRPTRDITDVSKNIHNLLAIGSLWTGVICAYIVGSHFVYNVTSALVGSFVGYWDGLGKINSLGDVHKFFPSIPKEFMDHLKIRKSRTKNNPEDVKKLDAAEFSHFWNKIVMNLREEDYISDLEQYALNMPENSGSIDVVQWPHFLLVGKVLHAIRLLQRAQQHTQSRWLGLRERLLQRVQQLTQSCLGRVSESLLQRVQQLTQSRLGGVLERLLQRVQQLTQSRLGGVWEIFWQRLQQQQHTHEDLWNEISRDDVYMKYAVKECFRSVKFILPSVLKNDGKEWVEGICEDIESSIRSNGNLCSEFQLNKLDSFVKAISRLTKILYMQKGPNNDIQDSQRIFESAENLNADKEAKEELRKVIQHDFLGNKKFDGQKLPDLIWPEDPELRSQIKWLHMLLTMKSAAHVPRNREARRRLEFFTNSLFMSMPTTKPVHEMLSFSVLTPFYDEKVLYSLDELETTNDDGVTLIDYLKNLYPDEWTNYCERHEKFADFDEDRDRYEYRLWASYRGQTLARTVRGTMYYQKALLLQAYREMLKVRGSGEDDQPSTSREGETRASINEDECLYKAKAHVNLKFTYVVTCQKYGEQKINDKIVADDIAFLLKKNEGLRVAFVDEVNNEFYSKLVKADKNGKEKEVYSIKLPGYPILGEGKPENQNHAIVFTRGNAIQAIDMNQDNYFEETLKMRNLLEEFHRKPAPTILGIREHIFTGSASSLASFMSNQETGFVTLGQRVMANPLKVRMHYGHPDVFDRVFHITRGGISKASRGINISEDIYAGFNSTLRQGSVTHHEYIQVGKGRDVGFNQIATFEGKVAGGNGEQVLSRDIYRLGQRFDFFRMLSLYYTTIGYYFSSLLMVMTLYILLYGNLIMALSGTRVPHVLNNTDMAPEWFLMIVLLPAIYMLLVDYLEQGLEKAVESFLAMFFSLGSIFFAFSFGTRIHWFGRTIIHGGASYQATGRGFVLDHIKFSENYRRYSRSHFVKGMEVLFLVVVYIIYGFHSVRAFYNNLLLLGGSILSISWIVAPFLFDSSPFDLNKNSEDWEDLNNWLNRKSVEVKSKDIKDQVKESWEIWWNIELEHIRTLVGRVTETILSLRFFIFPLVVGYKLDVQGLRQSLSNCVIHWIYVVVILLIYEFICEKKTMNQLFSKNRIAAIGALVIVHYYSAFGDIVAIMITVWGFISFFSNNRLATIGALAIAGYCSALGDTLAFLIAIITTVWGFLSICVAWKPTLEIFSLWTPVNCFAWICDTGMRALNTNANADLGMLLLVFLCEVCRPVLEIFGLWTPVAYLAWICDTGMQALSNFNVSEECKALNPKLEIISLWTLVKCLAWICDTGMGALMFKIANMFSQRAIRRYLVRNLFDQNISELLHNSSADSAKRHGHGF